MNKITEDLLKIVSDWKGIPDAAYNIREDTGCAGRRSTENIRIDSKTDKPGIDIHVKPGTRGEIVYIPACVTHSAVDDLVYNDFYIGAGADVTIVAGCGAKLTLFDEPEAGIDLWSFNHLIAVFQKLRRETRGTSLIISHQERILDIADEIVVLAAGRIAARGHKDEVLPKLLETGSSVNFCEGKVEANA